MHAEEEPGLQSLTWGEIVGRLSGAHHLWLATVGRGGDPSSTPVWGAVVDGSLFVYSERRTVKARNLAHNQRVVIHLESGSDPLILRGVMIDLGHPGEHPAVLQAFSDKYVEDEERPFLPDADPAFDVVWRLDPVSAVTWALPDTEASTRRWHREG
jgi:hypothetical protein